MAQTEYQRLTRTKSQHGIATSARCSLWLGRDHLLRIDSSGYTESYRRFFLRDIQAVIIRKTIGMQVWTLVHGMLALLWMICALNTVNAIWMGVWWSLTGLSLILLMVNLLLGPCCTFHIKTAVQNEAIPSINRMRKAREVLARLKPLLTAAQGELSREEILARREPAAQVMNAAALPTGFPLASEIPNPTDTATPPESGSNPASTSG
jgi:hypothetical protein